MWSSISQFFSRPSFFLLYISPLFHVYSSNPRSYGFKGLENFAYPDISPSYAAERTLVRMCQSYTFVTK